MFGIGSKVAAYIGAGTSVALGIALGVVVITKNAEIRTLDKSINDPVTGYAAKLERAQTDLTTCRTNRIMLEEATRRQNEAVETAKAEADRRVAGVTRQLQDARRAQASAEQRAAAIMAAQPGEDICASADALILGETGQ